MNPSSYTMTDEMYVIKRDGRKEPVAFDKVLERIRKAAEGLQGVSATRLAQLTLAEIHDGVHTSELDELAARLAMSYMTLSPDWATLGARLIISNCHKNTPGTFSEAMTALGNNTDARGLPAPALAADILTFIQAHADRLNAMIKPDRDFMLDYFGFKTLERSYLMKANRRIVETPQYLWLRVAVGLWASATASTPSDPSPYEKEQALEVVMGHIHDTYVLMSLKYFTHATPTLFNSGTPRPQMSSCYLVAMRDDSLEGIYDTLKDCAMISKYAGGIGLHCHNIRAQGTYIAGTQGVSNGLVPMLRVFNNTARYVDQCFTPDTPILTNVDGQRQTLPIADIKVGMSVMTSGCTEIADETGKHYVRPQQDALFTPTWRTVTAVVTHTYSGPLYHLTFDGHHGQTVRVTPKHPFLAQQATASEYDYTEAENLRVGSIIACPNARDGFSILEHIQVEEVTDATLYDLEVEGTHDYAVAGAGFVHNGGGKRNGSIAIYLEPWHADIQSFLKMKSNTGSEEDRARDLFYALWIPDLFMRRVESGGDWSLFCPHEAPGLSDVVGADFDALYTRYEREGKARRSIPAQKIWSEILVSQIETGTPYLLYKDAANAKSNQKNLGVIKSSNLCVAPETRVTVYDSMKDTASGITVEIASLVGQEVIVWNGTHMSSVVVHKTGVSQSLLRVTVEMEEFGTGALRTYRASLECTPYHKFIVGDDNDIPPLSEARRVEARNLKPGMELAHWFGPDGGLMRQRVVSVENEGRIDDTYCFTEHGNHVGIFNGILTGQCTEIMEYSSPEETAVCNLASIALPAFIQHCSADGSKFFDFGSLRTVVSRVTENLNRVIDINFYPTPETRRSNMRHRPIGIGVQGLADVFAMLGLAWESPEAALLNRRIFEHIYYAAVRKSTDLAAVEGAYETFAGSPAAQGQLQPDLWGLSLDDYATATELDWEGLKNRVKTTGLRNSLLLAPMPTASTSQILGYNECIEPFTSNIYARRTLAGEFTVVNRHLVTDLTNIGLWSPELKERIVAANGSIQGIPEIPDRIKALYKTVWEIKQKTLIDMAADRGAFICQSQSLNLFVSDPTIAKLSSMHFYAWKRGLKTGMYYLRTKSAVQAIKFTVDPTLVASTKAPAPAECLLCSS